MNAQLQPNRWSCLPTALAMAVNQDVNLIIDKLGHDGSRVMWPHLGEPQRRQGFHIQECVELLRRLNVTATPYEAVPTSAPSFDVPPFHIYFGGSRVDALVRFQQIIATTRGILTGTGHAVAYDRGQIWDPCGVTYLYTIDNCFKFNFTPLCAWSIR